MNSVPVNRNQYFRMTIDKHTKKKAKAMFPEVRPVVTLCMIDDWLDGARSRVNAKQFDMIQLVADRLKVELGLLDPEASTRAEGVEPLRYLLHGPPGTGKSHAVKLLTELFDVAGYKKGMDYEFVAFQATNAADLDGRTSTTRWA